MIFGKENFINEYDDYQESLKALAAITKLFSDSNIPYINYRCIENYFCDSFKAINLSREDIAFDAIKDINNIRYGIGLKTFLLPNRKEGFTTYKVEKVAEFNKERKSIINKNVEEATQTIIDLRNNRLDYAKNKYKIEKAIYHCVIRYCENDEKKILLNEYNYSEINKNNIILMDKNYSELSLGQKNKKFEDNIYFKDGNEYYYFNYSKSTLYKRFNIDFKNGLIIPIDILKDPLVIIKKELGSSSKLKL